MQTWVPNILGGYLAAPGLSKQVRHDAIPMMRFKQFVREEPGYGAQKGDRIYFNLVSKVSNDGSTINELEKMPETNVDIIRRECQVDEWGNSIPYTGKLEALAASNPKDITQQALRDDMAETIDTEIGAKFQAFPLKATPVGTASVPAVTYENVVGGGAPAATALLDITGKHVRMIIDRMKGFYKIKKYDGQNYICIHSVGFGSALRDDADVVEAAKYGDPDRLFAGEIGRYYGCRFVEENNVLGDTIGAAATYAGEAIFFGADPVVEAMAIAPEIRAKISTEYGRDRGLAWYSLAGWAPVDVSGVARRARGIHVNSA